MDFLLSIQFTLKVEIEPLTFNPSPFQQMHLRPAAAAAAAAHISCLHT